MGNGNCNSGVTMKKREQIYLDGRPTTYEELQVRFSCGPQTVARKLKTHGRHLLSSMFAKRKPAQQIIVNLPPVEDRSPGWLERREFPNAGVNGFSKCPVDSFSGYDSKGHAVYSGAR